MKNRHANLLRFILAGCLVATAQTARAQQTTGNSRNAPTSVDCRALVTVKGAVRDPSRFEMRRRVRLLEALALAGGLATDAEKTVQITHSASDSDCQRLASEPVPEKSERVEIYKLADVLRGDAKANPYLQPGDAVVVSRAPVVYVTGHVLAPQAIMLRGGLTVSQAIAAAGGVLPGGMISRVRIYRQATDGRTMTTTKMVVDVKAVKKGRAEDVALQPYDIVEVPEKGAHPSPLPEDVRVELPELPLRVIY